MLKDVEKLSVKKGIVPQTVKDVLQSLVDDDLVKQEKIGSSNYFWSFPSEASVKIESELVNLERSIEEVAAKKADMESQIKKARIGKEDSDVRKTKMKELCEIDEATKRCEAELAKYRENDPEAYKTLCEAVKSSTAAANRWLDNMECLLSWCKKQFAGREEDIVKFFNENGLSKETELPIT